MYQIYLLNSLQLNRVNLLCSSVFPALHGLLVSQSVMVCLSLAGVSKAVEHINKTIAPALVSQVGPFIVWL
jgi:hypothetical protein